MTSAILPHTTMAATESRRIGLSLSGGGFRASLFHIGVLARLAELDLLRQVEVLSCVSGGSIVGALYYLYLKRELDRNGELDTNRLIELIADMERHFLSVVQRNLRWRVFASLPSNLRLARRDYSRTDRLGDLLDRHLYRPVWDGDQDRPVEMRELKIHPRGNRDFNPVVDNATRHCKVPVLIINATTLNTGHNWRFEVDRMGEPAIGPRERQVDKNLRLGQNRYQGLMEYYAEMPLGQAVAASAAVPGVFEPFPLSQLYPMPHRPDGFLGTQLIDGGVHDNLGTEALRERGCTHFLVSDASGQMTDKLTPDTWVGAVVSRTSDILMDRVRELQLARLEDAYPGRVALMHLLRELEAPEVKPIGPADRGHVARDRAGTEVTSYGVQRRIQRLLARIRTDLDAFSDIEAFSLMADGYLMTKREFEARDQRGAGWTEGPHRHFRNWRFAAVFDVLRAPPDKLTIHLKVARNRLFKSPKLVPRLRFELGLALLATVVLSGGLGMVPAVGLVTVSLGTLASFEASALALILAYPCYLGLRSASRKSFYFSWLRRPLTWIGSMMTLLMALPLFLLSLVHLHAGRGFLNVGHLTSIGVEPVEPATQPPRSTAADLTPDKVARKAA